MGGTGRHVDPADDVGDHARRHGPSRRARSSARSWRRRTATPVGSPTPTASTSTARRGRTSRSRRGRTSASARGSVGTSLGSRWTPCSTGCRTCGSIGSDPSSCAGGNSARRGPRSCGGTREDDALAGARRDGREPAASPRPARRDREVLRCRAFGRPRRGARARSLRPDRPGGRRDPRGGSATARLRPRRRHRRRVPSLDVHEQLLRRGRRRPDRQDGDVPERPRRGRRAARARDRRPAAAGGLAGRPRGGVHGRR